jgi:hypothetical protein
MRCRRRASPTSRDFRPATDRDRTRWVSLAQPVVRLAQSIQQDACEHRGARGRTAGAIAPNLPLPLGAILPAEINNFVGRLQAVGAAQRASHVGKGLLYVVMGESNTHVLSYPGYKRLSKVPMWGFSTSNPNNGEVLIGGVGGSVKLYKHGFKNSIAEFVAPYPDETIRDSAFDPTTSDIALTIDTIGSRKSYVAVY